MNDNKSLFFNAKFSSFEKINESFLKAKCFVLALGKNPNKSHFTKENVNRAYPSLAYIPVVGHLMCDDNGTYYLGGHDMKLDISTLSLKSQCVPFGVAIPSSEPVYEAVTEDNGTISTYLTCEVVIWIGRYPELTDAFYNDDVFCGQSMEIYFSKSSPLKEDPTYTDIIDFSFDALCMLNKSDDEKFNVQPCFPSASIRPETFSIKQDEFKSLVDEMKNELSLLFNENKENQGGNILNEKNVILQKYGKTIKDLDFSIDDLSNEEFSIKMEELFGEKNKPVAFSATYNQKRDALRNTLDPVIVKDAGGNLIEETYFYVSDFDDEFVFVEVDHWTVDNYDCKYGRYPYTFDESTLTATISGDFEELVRVWLTLDEKAKLDEERANYETKYAALEKEFSGYKAEHSFLDSEFNELKEYRLNKETAERKEAENTLFAKYANTIGETVDFEQLKEKASEFSLESLEKECLYIIGKYAISNGIPAKENPKKPDSLKFGLEHKGDDNDDPIEATYKKYLRK